MPYSPKNIIKKMNKIEILQQIEVIFKDVLDDDSIVLTETSTANDVEGWNSLTHFLLVAEIEKHFKINFSSNEVLSWKNVGELLDAICSK
jgi:acyl carrier protein